MLDINLDEIILRPALQGEQGGLYACFVFKCHCSAWLTPHNGELTNDTWYCNHHAVDRYRESEPRYLEDDGVCWKCKTLPPEDRTLTYTRGDIEIEVKLCSQCKKTDQPALLAWLDTIIKKQPKVRAARKATTKRSNRASWKDQLGL